MAKCWRRRRTLNGHTKLWNFGKFLPFLFLFRIPPAQAYERAHDAENQIRLLLRTLNKPNEVGKTVAFILDLTIWFFWI
jgi:hypothetical protein